MVTNEQIENARDTAAEALANARWCASGHANKEPCATCAEALANAREKVDALIMRQGMERDVATIVRLTPKDVHDLAVSKGWWSGHGTPDFDPAARIPSAIALIHSEASEALEEWRNPNLSVKEIYFMLPTGPITFTEPSADAFALARDGNKPEGFGVELADVVIRVYDLAEALGIDIDRLMLLKHAFNTTRPQRHGGKRG